MFSPEKAYSTHAMKVNHGSGERFGRYRPEGLIRGGDLGYAVAAGKSKRQSGLRIDGVMGSGGTNSNKVRFHNFPYFLIPFAICLGLRILFLACYERDPSFSVLILDAYRFQQRGLEILNGHVLTGRPFDMVPLYPFILAAIYQLTGVSLLAVRIIQLSCGVISGLLIYLIGKRVFDRATAWLAFLLYALYGVFPYYELHLLATSMSILVLLLFVFLFLTAMERNAAWLCAAAGLAGGILALLRPNFLPVMGFVLLFLLYLAKKSRGQKIPAFSVQHKALFAGLLCLCLAASLLFNYMSSGEWVLLTAHSGINFYIGNNPEADGTYVAVKGIGGSPVEQVTDAAALAEEALGRKLSAAEVSSFWSGRALSFLKDDPVRAVILYLKKFAIFWDAYEVPSIADFYLGMKYLPRACRGAVWFGLISPLAFLGLLTVWKGRGYPVAFLYVVTLSYLAVLLLFYINGRYRLPVVPMLILFASSFLKWLHDKVLEKKWRTVGSAAAGSVILFILVHLNLPGLDTSVYEARGAARLGMVFISNQRYERAVSALDEAVRLDPNYYKAYLDRGVALFLQGKRTKSGDDFRKALALKADCWEAWQGLGNIALIDGRAAEAEDSYLKAMDQGGRTEELLVSLYQVYRKRGKADDAARVLEELTGLYPQKEEYALDLADIYEKRGRPESAVTILERYVHHRADAGADILKNLARLYGKSGRESRAEDILKALLASYPEDPEVYFRLGILYHKQRHYDLALGYYKEAVRRKPDDPLYYLNMGNIYAGLGRLKEAERTFMEALRLQPDMDQAKANLAEIRKRLSKE